MNKLSLLLLTHNSTKNLNKYFGWLKNCHTIDQVVIIDDNSDDNPKLAIEKLISQSTRLIFLKRKLDNFSSQRNFGLIKCQNAWVLWLDSDEEITQDFLKFISDFDTKNYAAYAFKRLEKFLNKTLTHGETNFLNHVRLFNKKNGQFVGDVHEVWQTFGPTQNTNYQLIHHGNPTVSKCIQKINFYSNLRAKELYHQNINSGSLQIIAYPLAKFIDIYILKLGFLDGIEGTIFAMLQSFHSFLVRSKLWKLHHQQSYFPG